ncbi:MAG: RNA polymerase sigma factor [Acidobacteria bacterium]|nr:RNA polymerase sigma factor [Acidobacteriota bacterium]
MTYPNPLAEEALTDAEDQYLVRCVQSGSKEALELLIARHQRWIYNIALRMVCLPQDAEDATQEVLIKLLTKLSTFRGESQFRTWLYRLVINHLLNMKRARAEAKEMTFEDYGRELDSTPEADLAAPDSQRPDAQLLIEEAKIGCTSAMLLCLTREQRLVYVLGEIFGVTDRVGAELLDISRDSFRQKLARARRDLYNFMQGKCGLVKASNPCRCAKKMQGFIQLGYLDPQNLLFVRERMVQVREVTEKRSEQLDAFYDAYAEIHRNHPFHNSPDFVASLRSLIERTNFQSAFEA